MKRVCNGCDYAAQKRGMFGCPFCRAPYADNDADALAMIQARAVKKDPDAIYNLGIKCYHGELGLQKDMRKAVELWTEAAELGSVDALYSLGSAYYNGEGVEVDKTKGAEFYAKAAMQGHVISRHNLGIFEAKKVNFDRAVRHYLISSKMGDKDSIEAIQRMYMTGNATNEQFTEALEGYVNAVENTKSRDRDEAKRHGY